MRKIIQAILVALLLIMTITGCSAKKSKEADMGMEAERGTEAEQTLESGLSMGRYVEEELVFPEGVKSGDFVSITASPEGDIELYTYSNGSYQAYLINKKWRKVEAEALQKINNIDAKTIRIRQVLYGEDKKQYLLGETISDYYSVLYRLSDSGVFEKVALKRFEETNEDWGNLPYRPNVIKVLENGMIAVAYPWNVIEVYSSDGQSILGEYRCGRSSVLAVEGNTLYYIDQNDKELLSINMETKKKGSPRPLGIDPFVAGALEINSGNAYICNTNGIHLNMEGASLWETLIEGDQCSLNMPTISLKDYVIGTEEDFYIVVTNMGNTDVNIKHIYFAENVSSVPPITLSIFSIEDNPTIRQAITIFQESHPEVRIHFSIANTDNELRYTYGLKNPKQTIPLKDQINAMNTELLAGKGPDIIVLDGMPIDSYIDKGVLEDMGSIFSSMKDSDELLPNITAPYELDGKVYAMPLHFRLPFIYGASDAVNAANSIQELAEYARSNNEIPLLAPNNYRALAAWLFMIYYDRSLDQDQEIDKVALQEFLEDINVISEAIHASDDARMSGFTTSGGPVLGYWMAGAIKVYRKEYQANIEELGGMMDFSLPLKAVQEVQGSLRAMNHLFKATGLVGINKEGNQKELAKEFIQLLLSKDIQRLNLEGAFPVNKAAMEEWIKTDSQNYIIADNMEGGTIRGDYPDQDSRDMIYEWVCAAGKPMVNDIAMMDMILDEAERYLRGDITAEQAAGNAAAGIQLYLSE